MLFHPGIIQSHSHGGIVCDSPMDPCALMTQSDISFPTFSCCLLWYLSSQFSSSAPMGRRWCDPANLVTIFDDTLSSLMTNNLSQHFVERVFGAVSLALNRFFSGVPFLPCSSETALGDYKAGFDPFIITDK